jgi:transcriptional regulator NrdR family protein
MVCIQCGGNTKVINSRLQKRINQVWRRRQCSTCNAIFTTEELANYALSWMVKDKNSQLNPFNRYKLFVSLNRSCSHRTNAINDASGLCLTVISRLQDQNNSGLIDSQFIKQTCQVTLNRFDKVASLHYQALHRK